MVWVTPWQTSVQFPEKVPVSVKTGKLLGPWVGGEAIRVSKLIRCVWFPEGRLSGTTPCGSWHAEQVAPFARCPLCPPPVAVVFKDFFLKLWSPRMLFRSWHR